MDLADLQAIGIVCGTILSVCAVIVIVYKVVSAVWRTIQRLNAVADDLLGDKVRGTPSLTQRVADLSRQVADLQSEHAKHMREWHPAQIHMNTPRNP